MSNDAFSIPVPQDELDSKPSFLLPNGWYGSTIQPGAEVVKNDNGWAGVRIPFAGFTNREGKAFDKSRNYQVTTKSDNVQAAQIGAKQLVQIAVAFGLAEETTVAGKPAQKLTASDAAEFVEQLNGVAGSPCDVYVTTKKRKRGKEIVMRDDGNGPVLDNEISAVAAAGQGK